MLNGQGDRKLCTSDFCSMGNAWVFLLHPVWGQKYLGSEIEKTVEIRAAKM